jgi:hypothetical protein
VSTQTATVRLIKELLYPLLAGSNHQRSLEMGAFIPSPGNGMVATGCARVVVESEDMITGDATTEIILTGSVENSLDRIRDFTLCLSMDHAVPRIYQVTSGDWPVTFFLYGNHPYDRLVDAVFELVLQVSTAPGTVPPLGRGRGFFLFDDQE